MSTKHTLFLFQFNGVVLPLFGLLYSTTKHQIFIFLAVASSLVGFALTFYAAYREKTYGDKSVAVSRRAAVTILSVIGLWIVFILYRALAR